MRLKTFKRQLHREYLLQIRQPWRLIYGALFFFIAVVFFPLSLPFKPDLVRALGPGFIWINLLFASLLSSIGFFEQDEKEGVLEQWLVSGQSLLIPIGAKVLVHWACYMISIIVLSPLIGILFNLNTHELLLLNVSLVVGTPALFLLCALAAAFNLNQGILMGIILMPLALPILIFGSAILRPLFQVQDPMACLALLAAISLIAIVLLPIAIAAILRISLTE